MTGNEYVITVFASATKDGKDLVSKVNNDAFRAFVDARLTVGGASRCEICSKCYLPIGFRA